MAGYLPSLTLQTPPADGECETPGAQPWVVEPWVAFRGAKGDRPANGITTQPCRYLTRAPAGGRSDKAPPNDLSPGSGVSYDDPPRLGHDVAARLPADRRRGRPRPGRRAHA